MKKIALFITLTPYLLLIATICVFILLIAHEGFSESQGIGDNAGGCSISGDINKEKWDAAFAQAGVLSDKGDTFLEIAAKQGIDPVLFAAISFNETAWGTSNAVISRNNPGGLMDSNGLMTFATLDEGLEAMGLTLHNRIVVDGLDTIEKLGAVYCPVGAANDPTGMNARWIPTVHSIVNKLGGLTSNCSQSGGTGKYIIPVDNPVISSGFSNRVNPVTGVAESHKGLDFAQPTGSNIKAADDGTVVFAGFGASGSGFGGYGNVVLIEHSLNKEWTLYAHQSKLLVKTGQKVKQGDVIGQVGSTGQSTGPHLHFEIRKQKMSGWIDPAPILGIK
ncbi:peptidoglycan DD-metalloendopeptidase family protein [Listeria seeligeri]|uniref:peptidoglycan DD-metalloendopeptidase family protein n=1 Tax=Listeria seeligeri TaxID=1640 RepID=UPI0010CFAE4C|nr:peptidoglycan DD-metalloendopeptidase family protein [Listeria seeligeri]EAD3476095.1 peptidase M23 [Listeria monocytogenes]EAG4636591.1 peptidase M23 [Listeria monocytogenes]EAH4084461.1 peptidase M23 [Listeria monocytogenes]EIF6131958.1 peptidoglycan DD-metalloendopeptidase family protein [Listeria monocytogenes]MBC1595245.1 peptidoglycan DD-metalloendopeptidase family protein [Listeria seeligeri]